jgi:hypothetical protein
MEYLVLVGALLVIYLIGYAVLYVMYARAQRRRWGDED